MSLQVTSNNDHQNVTKLHHDLGGVLGNLRAFEFLLFSQSDSEKHSNLKVTYTDLMLKLDKILAGLSALDSGNLSLASKHSSPTKVMR